MGLQPDIAGQFPAFFSPNPQFIPGATAGQMDILGMQRARAFGEPRTPEELAALGQAQNFLSVPFGELPSTLAGMSAIRNPILNEAALAGLGNSDAVTSNLAAGLAPLLESEMRLRASLIPQLASMGGAIAQRQSGLLGEYGTSEEALRQIEAKRGEANLLDLLRRQGLGSQFTTGLIQPMPSTVTKSTTGGGGGMSVICTELYCQGWMDRATYEADARFGATLPREVIFGYHRFGIPIANAMRKSRTLTAVLAWPILKWAKEMRSRVEGGRGSIIGKLIMAIGLPICRMAGKRKWELGLNS